MTCVQLLSLAEPGHENEATPLHHGLKSDTKAREPWMAKRRLPEAVDTKSILLVKAVVAPPHIGGVSRSASGHSVHAEAWERG